MLKFLISSLVRQGNLRHFIIFESEFLFNSTLFLREDHIEPISWEIIADTIGTTRYYLIINILLFYFFILIVYIFVLVSNFLNKFCINFRNSFFAPFFKCWVLQVNNIFDVLGALDEIRWIFSRSFIVKTTQNDIFLLVVLVTHKLLNFFPIIESVQRNIFCN